MKILLVRLRLIGDVVLTTPLLGGLKRRYPHARLTYVVEAPAAPVVRDNPNVDEVLSLPPASGIGRLWQDFTTGNRLRRTQFDVAIDLHGGPRSAWLVWASRAPLRIGYSNPGRAWMYTHTVTRTADDAVRHSVLNQWDLLAPLAVGRCDRERDPVEMIEDGAASAHVATALERSGIPSTAPLVVVHVSAGNLFRRWPADAFASTIEHLARRDATRRFIVTSGPSDAHAARRIAAEVRQRLGTGAEAIPEFPDLTLAELRSLIGRASLYLGGDSGPLHVAATTTTPIVALFGPTLAERSFPWRHADLAFEGVDGGALPCRPCRQRVCTPGDFRCLTGIPSERVIAACERALAHPARPAVRRLTTRA